MNFTESEKINVTGHMEKKGRFTYLSWPFAVSEFRKNYPNGAWDISSQQDSGQPYCVTPAGCFVEVSVTPDIEKPGLTFTQIHPVLNNQNKTVAEPNAFEINTSIQRCLVKAIALATGIGLHIYAGEDLPPNDADGGKGNPPKTETEAPTIKASAKLFNEMHIEIGKCTKAPIMAKWFTDNVERINAGLSADDKVRLKAVYKEYSDIFKKEAKA